MSAPHAGATKPNKRIDALDVLRGLALFGVLAINTINEFRVSIFEQILGWPINQTPIDRVFEAALTFAFSFKALALFSFLFGVGIAIQFERLDQNPRRLLLLFRRLSVLLVFGILHFTLIWNGDILAEYAIAGYIALFFLFGPRWLMVAAAVLFMALYLAMPLLPLVLPFPANSWIVEHVREARNVYGSGDFEEIIAFRIRETPEILSLHFWIFPRTLSLFLFGAAFWRSGLMRSIGAHRRFVFLVGTIALIGAVCCSLPEWFPDVFALRRGWRFVFERVAFILMATAYGALVLAAMTTSARVLFAWAAPLGRMALTNYLLQSVVMSWIFYSYGLGLFGRVGVAAAFAIAAALYVVQVFLSKWWLTRYEFGPMEWLWRTLMYGASQPMRRLSLTKVT